MMPLRLLITTILLGVLIGTSAVAARAQDATPDAALSTAKFAQPEWLVNTEWLDNNLDDPSLTIVALVPADTFAEAHIPGAVQIDWPELKIVETGDQSIASWREEVEGILTDLGVERSDTVVVYDNGSFYAARLWWILHQLGHADVRILDGGIGAWTDTGFTTDSGVSAPASAPEPYQSEPNEEAVAQIDEVIAALDRDDVVLIDARAPNEYQEGHIPGAVNIPFTDNAQAEGTRYWKSSSELLSMYAEAGVTPDDIVIPYCTTGVRSAATYFTLKLLGFENVSLFTGSYVEWTSDADRPVATPEAS
jgi:thiosulfate/3-mercaptopyruvate sulfurtransferase